MTAEALPFFSFDEYLRLDEVSEQRYEWVAGQVYAMSGGSDRHLATVQALFERIAPLARGQGCRPWMADRRLRTDRASYDVGASARCRTKCSTSRRVTDGASSAPLSASGSPSSTRARDPGQAERRPVVARSRAARWAGLWIQASGRAASVVRRARPLRVAVRSVVGRPGSP